MVLFGCQDNERFLPYATLTDWFVITDMGSVNCGVRSEALYRTDTLYLRVNELDPIYYWILYITGSCILLDPVY